MWPHDRSGCEFGDSHVFHVILGMKRILEITSKIPPEALDDVRNAWLMCVNENEFPTTTTTENQR